MDIGHQQSESKGPWALPRDLDTTVVETWARLYCLLCPCSSDYHESCGGSWEYIIACPKLSFRPLGGVKCGGPQKPLRKWEFTERRDL